MSNDQRLACNNFAVSVTFYCPELLWSGLEVCLSVSLFVFIGTPDCSLLASDFAANIESTNG